MDSTWAQDVESRIVALESRATVERLALSVVQQRLQRIYQLANRALVHDATDTLSAEIAQEAACALANLAAVNPNEPPNDE